MYSLGAAYDMTDLLYNTVCDQFYRRKCLVRPEFVNDLVEYNSIFISTF